MRHSFVLFTLLLSLISLQDDKLVYDVDGNDVLPIERMKAANITGMSIHLITDFDDVTALNYGVTDYDSESPMTSETLFQAGGLTNTVTNVLAMIAVQEGKVDLNKNVNDYLTTWKIPENKHQKKNPVTLEDLLLKRRGFKQQGKPNGYSKGEKIPSLQEVMNGTGTSNTDPIMLKSGTTKQGNYSFETEMVVQILLEDIYRTSFGELAQEKIFDPLGMTNSFFAIEVPTDLENQIAHGYLQDGSQVPGIYKRYPEIASSGLWTSSSDYGKLVRDLLLSASGKKDGTWYL